MNEPAPAACIGVFDSGVGGLTVLRELHRQIPQAPLLYLADAACAPYGEKTPDFLIQRSLAITAWLQQRGASLVVIACNTATAHAIQAVRERFPGLPIVGTEPGIKPAVEASRNHRIGVLATPATLASARYRSLIERHAQGTVVLDQPCPGLADAIESGDFDAPALAVLVQRFCEPLRAADVDTVLMGCTHYPLIRPLLQRALGPDVRLLDIETAVAQQARRLWAAPPDAMDNDSLRLATTGSAPSLQRFVERALGWQELGVEAAQL